MKFRFSLYFCPVDLLDSHYTFVPKTSTISHGNKEVEIQRLLFSKANGVEADAVRRGFQNKLFHFFHG